MRLADELVVTAEGWQRLNTELAELRARREARLEEHWEDRELDRGIGSGEPSDIILLNRRIAELEVALARALVVGRGDRELGRAGVGSWVAVRWENGDEDTFVLVGPLEADASVGRISCESPVGAALLGRTRGEVVDVTTPGGGERLTVLAVRDEVD